MRGPAAPGAAGRGRPDGGCPAGGAAGGGARGPGRCPSCGRGGARRAGGRGRGGPRKRLRTAVPRPLPGPGPRSGAGRAWEPGASRPRARRSGHRGVPGRLPPDSMLRPSRRRAPGDRRPGRGAPCARPDGGLARGCFSVRLGFEAKSKRRPAGSETCGGPGPRALTGLSGAGRSSSLADPRGSWGARPGGRGVLGPCSVPGAASCWLRAGRCGALLGPRGDPGTERADPPPPVVVGPWGARERLAAGGRPESATEVGRAAANPAGALGAPRRCSGQVRGSRGLPMRAAGCWPVTAAESVPLLAASPRNRSAPHARLACCRPDGQHRSARSSYLLISTAGRWHVLAFSRAQQFSFPFFFFFG